MGCAFSPLVCADGRHPGRDAGWRDARSKWPDRFIALALLEFLNSGFSGWRCSHFVLFAHAKLAADHPGDLTCFMKLTGYPVSPSLTHGFQIRRGVMRKW